MGKKRLLVTVGTTSFEDLIVSLAQPQIIKALKEQGFLEWRIQYGRCSAEVITTLDGIDGIDLVMFDYRTDLSEDIEWADLVVGHAGAGTVLDVLRGPIGKIGKDPRPALLIVTNDRLMNGHQSELAEALAKESFSVSCSVEELRLTPDSLLQKAQQSRKALPPPNFGPLEACIKEFLQLHSH